MFKECLRAAGASLSEMHDQGDAVIAGAGRLAAVPDALTAEASVCAKALQAATDLGISRIQLEMDSSLLQQALVTSSMDLALAGS